MATPTHLHVDIGVHKRARAEWEELFSAHVRKWGWVIALRQVGSTDAGQWHRCSSESELYQAVVESTREGTGIRC